MTAIPTSEAGALCSDWGPVPRFFLEKSMLCYQRRRTKAEEQADSRNMTKAIESSNAPPLKKQ